MFTINFPLLLLYSFVFLDVEVLYNSELTFGERIYGPLDVDVCRIKLHEPLSSIVQQPLLYVRDMVPKPCFEALVRLDQVGCVKYMVSMKGLLWVTAKYWAMLPSQGKLNSIIMYDKFNVLDILYPLVRDYILAYTCTTYSKWLKMLSLWASSHEEYIFEGCWSEIVIMYPTSLWSCRNARSCETRGAVICFRAPRASFPWAGSLASPSPQMTSKVRTQTNYSTL